MRRYISAIQARRRDVKYHFLRKNGDTRSLYSLFINNIIGQLIKISIILCVCSTQHAELGETSDTISASPQLIVDIPSNCCNEHNASRDLKLQQSNITKIVKEKDLVAFHQFGGAQGFAEALDTDLDKGMCWKILIKQIR